MFSDEMRTIRSKVQRIMEDNPSARDSDKELMLIYLKEWHGINGDLFNQMRHILLEAPSFETIQRVRRKIQEEGYCQPSTQATFVRRERQAQFHNSVSKGLW